MKKALAIAAIDGTIKNRRETIALLIARATQIKKTLELPRNMVVLSKQSVDPSDEGGRINRIICEQSSRLEDPVGFSARLVEIGDMLKRLHSPKTIEGPLLKWQGSRVPMNQGNLMPDKRTKDLFSVLEVSADEIDDNNPQVRMFGADSPPMPPPTTTDIKNHGVGRHPFQKTFDLPIHNRNRMMPRNHLEMSAPNLRCDAFPELSLRLLFGFRKLRRPYPVGA